MSGKALGWAVEQTTGSVLAKSVLLRLADMADERWSCWPGVKLLAAETEATERGVRKALRLLEERGLITTMVRHRENGSATSSRYFLNAPAAPHMALYGSLDEEPVIETPLSPPVATTPRNSVPHPPELSSPPPGTQFPPGGELSSPPEPPYEPPSEPAREDVREDVRRVLDALGEPWTVGRSDAFELEPAMVRALDELGWTAERLARELAKNPGQVRYPSRVLKRRLTDLRAMPGPRAAEGGQVKAEQPACAKHPRAAHRADGECVACFGERIGAS